MMNQLCRLLVLLIMVLFLGQAQAQTGKYIEPVKDESLTAAEYEKLGMPSIEKAWTANDLQKAAAVIKNLKKTPEKLPRYQSKTSGAVFQKFIDLKETEAIVQSAKTDVEQMMKHMELMMPVKEIMAVYGSAAWPTRSLTVEQIELGEPLLFHMMKAQKKATAFLATFDPNDETYPVRKQGLEKVQVNLGTMVASTIIILTDHTSVRPETRLRHSSIMRTYVPDILNGLNAKMRTDYRNRLLKFAATEKDSKVKEQLDQLLEKVTP
jgi:hypothetical protein